jgi:hypothetical protein
MSRMFLANDPGDLTHTHSVACQLGTFCATSICICLKIVRIRGKRCSYSALHYCSFTSRIWLVRLSPSGKTVKCKEHAATRPNHNVQSRGYKEEARITKQPLGESGLPQLKSLVGSEEDQSSASRIQFSFSVLWDKMVEYSSNYSMRARHGQG